MRLWLIPILLFALGLGYYEWRHGQPHDGPVVATATPRPLPQTSGRMPAPDPSHLRFPGYLGPCQFSFERAEGNGAETWWVVIHRSDPPPPNVRGPFKAVLSYYLSIQDATDGEKMWEETLTTDETRVKIKGTGFIGLSPNFCDAYPP